MAALPRLSAADLSNLRLETPAAPMHIGGLLVLEAAPLLDASGGLDLERLRARIQRRLSNLPELRRRLRFPGPFLGRPLWVDDADFRVDRHVGRVRVEAPGTEAQLLAAAARLMSPLLDRRRPLWELWFLEGMAEGRLGVLLKIHHALADGLGTVALAGALLDVDPQAADPPAVAWGPAPAPGVGRLLADSAAGKAAAVRRAARALAQPRPAGRALRATLADLRRTLRDGRAAPAGSLNRPVRPGRRLRHVDVDLDAARRVAAAAGGKVNDVVLALVTGGLRDLLLARGEAVAGLELVTSVPVSLRPGSEARALGNQAGLMVVRLPVGEGAAGRQLRRIVAATRRAKAEQRPAYGQQLMAALAATPVARALINRQRMVNVFVTNVAGPPLPLYLLGAPVLEVVPIVISAGNVTVAVCALSYAGRLCLAVTADAAACPDVDAIAAGMRRSWAELAAASGEAGADDLAGLGPGLGHRDPGGAPDRGAAGGVLEPAAR